MILYTYFLLITLARTFVVISDDLQIANLGPWLAYHRYVYSLFGLDVYLLHRVGKYRLTLFPLPFIRCFVCGCFLVRLNVSYSAQLFSGPSSCQCLLDQYASNDSEASKGELW